MTMTDLYMFVGFSLSAYAIIANDSIQTLGTFIASNKQRPWWQLWLFSASILLAVLVYSWVMNQGDPSYGRLDKFPYNRDVYGVMHVIPPIALLILTRYGMPVSTTFLILTFFEPKNLEQMLIKSVFGYGVAFVAGLAIFWAIHKLLFSSDVAADQGDQPTDHATPLWLTLQALSTAFLWSQWLIQDLANLFVYMPHTPEKLPLTHLSFCILVLLGTQLMIFKGRGGRIQKIVEEKSQTSDIREATIISLVYGLVILYFKEYNKMPMSTTWVFLGLLAGREIGYRLRDRGSFKETSRMIFSDLGKATVGIVVSVILAAGLPHLFGH